MAKSTPSVVLLKSMNRDGTKPYEEAQAGGAISAGHLIELDHSTTPPTATASDGVPAYDQLYIALEKEYDDANTKDALDAAYASGEHLRYVKPLRGEVYYVIAAGVIAQDALVINGGATTPGTFITSGTVDATTVTNTLKGKAITAGTDGNRFKMEVL